MKKENAPNKVLRYIKVYNDILNMIQSGIYTTGSRLPSENELSALLGVSRMTLRQALFLLQEDGYIVMKHGLGSYVNSPMNVKTVGLETKTNPVHKSCTYDLTLLKMDYRIDVPSEYVTTTLGRMVPWVMGIDRYYGQNEACYAYGFSMLPYDTVERFSISSDNEDALRFFLENTIYEVAHRTRIEIRFVKGNDIVHKHEIQTSKNSYILLLETVYDNVGTLLLHNKFYIPEEYAQLSVFTS